MDLTQLIGQIPAAAISLALGAVICFAGYKVRKVGIMLTGAMLGFTVASGIAGNFAAEQSTAVLVGVIAAVLVALFCSWLYDAGIFVFCGGCAALFAAMLLARYDLAEWLTLVIVLAVFVAVGVLALQFVRPVMIVATGLSGAGSVLSSLALLGLALPAGAVHLAALLVLAAAGIAVQFATTK